MLAIEPSGETQLIRQGRPRMVALKEGGKGEERGPAAENGVAANSRRCVGWDSGKDSELSGEIDREESAASAEWQYGSEGESQATAVRPEEALVAGVTVSRLAQL